MEKKTILLLLVPGGAIQMKTSFLIGDRGIAMALYQKYVFFAREIRFTR